MEAIGCFNPDFVPQVLVDERLKRFPAALDNERLQLLLATFVEKFFRSPDSNLSSLLAPRISLLAPRQNKPHGRLATPLTDIQLRMLALVGDATHENGIFLGTEFVDEHFRERRGDGEGFSVAVDETVGGLCPFQDDVRPIFLVKREKTTVQPPTFRLENAHRHVDAGVAQSFDAASLHLGERVDAAHDDAPDAFSDNQIAARRRFSVVRTGFERHVERGLRKQMLVVGFYGGKGVHLGVTLATAHVVALANHPAVGHNHATHHRVRARQIPTALRQLNAASHEFFVERDLVFIHFFRIFAA